MSEADTLPADVHPEAALLPWYANDTLPEHERQQVVRHLESCADCRRELDDLVQMKTQLTAVYRLQQEPSSQLARSVFAKVGQEASARRSLALTRESWLDRLDRWFASLFIPQWVPTLAVTLIVAQLGLLVWLTLPQAPEQGITTRSVAGPTATFKVTFEDRASEKDIRAVLTEIGARIVDGPDAAHAYIIQANAANSDVAQKKLDLMRKRSDVVRTADLLTR